MQTTTTQTTMIATITPINEDYEWFQYNNKLKIIHSIKDDMYQMQSIINACNSNKLAKDWFRNKATKEFLGLGEFSQTSKLYENRENLSNNLKGTYIHRKLINHVAIWCSPTYSWHIMNLLDDIFKKEREEIIDKIDKMKTRNVPKGKEYKYKYLIWKEELDDESTISGIKGPKVALHLIRRNKDSFRGVSEVYKNAKKWFFRDNLPISMTPNEDIKTIIKNNCTAKEAKILPFKIIVVKNKLDNLFNEINNYFDTFQEE